MIISKEKVLLQFFLTSCLISLVLSCNQNCRMCGSMTTRSTPAAVQDMARTFGPFVQSCCCSGTGDVSGISNTQCGVKKAGTKIVGGTATEVNEYPWLVALARRTGDWAGCGGSLIASQWVLTAAHCLVGVVATDLAVLIGEHDLTDSSRIIVNVAEIFNNPSYNENTYQDDIALLKLETEVDLATYTPVCIPEYNVNYEGKSAFVYGWGTTTSGGSTSVTQVLEAEVSVVQKTTCETNYGGSSVILDGMLCAAADGKDACQGDSGGPLSYAQTDASNRHVQIGVVSWGFGCADPAHPGVYADVSYYRMWIECTLQDNGGAVFTS